MTKSKKLPNQVKVSDSDQTPAARVLMNNGFLLLLLNMLYGLLPITISGNRLHYSSCSLSTFYSISLMIVMGFLSFFFIPITSSVFEYSTSNGIADVLAVLINVGAHVVGFIGLTLQGHKVAKNLPTIWDSTVRVFQISVIDIHGKSYKPIWKLRRFCTRNFILYAIFLIGFTVVSSLTSMMAILTQFSINVTPLRSQIYAYGVFTGYVIWDLVSLSHILICLLVHFFLIVIIICLKSSNDQLREVFATENDIIEGNGDRDTDDNVKFCGYGPGPAQRETAFEVQLTKELQKITEVYTICEDVTIGLSQTFGISLIIEVLIMLGNILVNLYFLIQMSWVKRAFETIDYGELMIICLYNFFFLFQLSCSVSKMINESRKPLLLLEGIQYNYNSPRIKEKIQSFKFDIANTRITLSAEDFFQLDKRLISTLVGAVTTYLIVMLQFSQQDDGQERYV